MGIIFVEGLMPDPICRDYILEAFNVYDQNSLVLDVGCGTGFFTSKFPDAIGLDLSRENVLLGKRLLPDREFVLADASHLPFRNESLEFVVSLAILEHLSNPLTFLNDLCRCLKKKGRYLLSFDVYSRTCGLVGFVTSRVIVERALWHKRTVLSDPRNYIVLNQTKTLEALFRRFKPIWIKKFRGFLVNFLIVISILAERLTRPRTIRQKTMGSQYIRVNSRLIRFYIQSIKPLVEKVCRNDPFKWDASSILLLVEKQ